MKPAKLDPEVLTALRFSRAAVKKLAAAAESLREAGGWWGDVDGFLERKLDDAASVLRGHARALEADMDEVHWYSRPRARKARP